MAIKTAKVVITDDNRDKGKTYLITEMDAFKAANWARKMLFSINISMLDIDWIKRMVDIDENGKMSLSKIADLEMAGVAAIGVINLFSSVPPSVMDALEYDMLGCCEFIPSPNVQGRPVLDKVPGDIEEPSTVIKLQASALALHLDFLKAAKSLATGQ